jgi:hypothetical protein
MEKFKICWEKQIQRNILNICESVLEAKQWDNPFIFHKIRIEKPKKEESINYQRPLFNFEIDDNVITNNQPNLEKEEKC